MSDKLTVGGASPHMYGHSVCLGKQGEFGYTVEYDFSDWVDEYGDGTVGWMFRRPKENTPYLLPHTETDNISQITITETELQIDGYGEMEIFFINNELTNKRISRSYVVLIGESLDTSSEVPEPYQSYVDAVHEDAMEVRQIKDEIDHLQFRVTNDGILEVNI